MRLARSIAATLLFALLLLSGGAHAQAVAASDDAESVEGLEAELEAQRRKVERFDAKLDAGELQAEDCANICDYLAAMQRTVERLCKLAPGSRCEAARAKVDAARLRVRKACPQCEADNEQFQAGADAPVAPKAVLRKSAAPPADEDEGEPLADAPAPASERGGGCAGCAVASSDDGGAHARAVLLLLAALLVRRRRRRGWTPS